MLTLLNMSKNKIIIKKKKHLNIQKNVTVKIVYLYNIYNSKLVQILVSLLPLIVYITHTTAIMHYGNPECE